MRVRLGVILVIVIGFLTAHDSRAQTTTGTIEGKIRDASGAVVPSAEVTLVNLATNQSRALVSDDAGRFTFAQVRSGDYRVGIRLTGFKTFSTPPFHLEVAGLQNLNPVLEVGEMSETVEVAGAVQKVNTEQGVFSSVVTGRQIEALPLNGRNVFQLALLQPGVTAGLDDGIDPTFIGAPQGKINASGHRTRGNNFGLDGISNNDGGAGGATSVTPSLDSVQEFRIANNNFSAEYGRNDGAIINVITKSGTNQVRGSVNWFHRNDALDTREFFDVGETATLRRHQVGITIGGPLIQDRTFGFFAFEGIHTLNSESEVQAFETPDFRRGVNENYPGSTAAQLLNTYPGPTPTQDLEDMGSFNSRFLSLGPKDGISDLGNAVVAPVGLDKTYQYNVRIDHELDDANKIFFRYVWEPQEFGDTAARGPIHVPVSDGLVANGVISDTHILSPDVINELRFGYNRVRFDADVPRDTGAYDLARFLISAAQGAGITGFGAVHGTPLLSTNEEYHLVDVLSLNLGDHSVRTGFEYRWNQDDGDQQLFTRGIGVYTNLFDFAANLPYAAGFRTDPAVTSGVPPQIGTPQNFRQSEFALFLQDDWKVNDRFTLNLGLRYDNYGQLSELRGRLANLVHGSGDTIDERIASAVVDIVEPDGIFRRDNNNFGPRFGFAYDMSGDGRTSLRGGFGVAYDRLFFNVTRNIRFNPPLSSAVDLRPLWLNGTAGLNPQQWAEKLGTGMLIPFRVPAGIQSAGLNQAGGPQFLLAGELFSPPPGLRSPDPGMRTSYSMNWFLGFQRELAWDMILEANYVGNGGRKLGFIEVYNRFEGSRFGFDNPVTRQPSRGGFLNEFFGFENTRTNNVNSSHHGGNLSLQKRFSQRLSFQTAYTFGKTLDYGSDNFGNNTGEIYAVSPKNQHLEKGLAAFDVRQRWVSNFIWEIPLLRGAGGIRESLLGGWQLQGILTLQNGTPFTPQMFSDLRDHNGDFVNNDRPDPPRNTTQFNGLSTHHYATGVFGSSGAEARGVFNPDGAPCNRRNTPPGTSTTESCVEPGLGLMGRSLFIGPGYQNLDLSLFKNFAVPWFSGDGAQVQFRAEFFNLTNRVNLQNVNRSFTESTFGRSVSSFDAREIQFGLKFIF